MATGGMLLGTVERDDRLSLGLPETGMALTVVHVGQYAPHDAAKKAGILNGDIILSFDGRTDLLRETDVLAYALALPIDKEVAVSILRDGEKQTLRFSMQP
jgi:S1-C subfamily serine protease